MYKIYYLTSILDCFQPRYIGYTKDLEFRLICHINDSRYNKCRSHKTNWINSLLKKKVKPIIVCLEDHLDFSEVAELEVSYIKHFSEWYNLTNSTSGGEKFKTYKKSVKDKISQKLKEYYSKNNSWNKGKKYKFSEDRNQKRREKIGDKISGENNHFFGKKHKTETKKLLSQKNRIHNYTYEQIFDLYIRKNLTGVEVSEKLNISYIAIKKAIQRYKLRSIKEEIYGKIKGNKDAKEVDFDIYYDKNMY
jgi:hypothetical protein